MLGPLIMPRSVLGLEEHYDMLYSSIERPNCWNAIGGTEAGHYSEAFSGLTVLNIFALWDTLDRNLRKRTSP